VNLHKIKPLYKNFKVDKYKFHNPSLVKADLRSSVHLDISYARGYHYSYEDVQDREFLSIF